MIQNVSLCLLWVYSTIIPTTRYSILLYVDAYGVLIPLSVPVQPLTNNVLVIQSVISKEKSNSCSTSCIERPYHLSADSF